jgi:hypothetical protein
VLLLAFGCSLLGREEVGPPEASGWYIRLQPTSGIYTVETLGSDSTDPYGNPCPYTMGFTSHEVHAADQRTKLSADWDWDVPESKTVTLGESELVYIIVDASEEDLGTYAIRIVL